jgi:hypothetical protein
MNDMLEALKAKVGDDFSHATIDAAGRALADTANPLRANFFATAMRILYEHTMGVLAPQVEVKDCAWFKAERDDGEPTRVQRIKYSIHGGFSEEFVSEKLNVDPAALSKRFIGAVDELSKHVHGRANTVITDKAEQDAFAVETLQAMAEFFDAATEARAAIVGPIEDALNDAAVDALMEETLQDVDELASHYSLEEVYVDKIEVQRIGAKTLTYRATGSINVVLQWGSNLDVRRGDGAELEQTFPVTCDITLPIADPWDLDQAETQYGVDTSEWHEAMAPSSEEES